MFVLLLVYLVLFTHACTSVTDGQVVTYAAAISCLGEETLTESVKTAHVGSESLLLKLFEDIYAFRFLTEEYPESYGGYSFPFSSELIDAAGDTMTTKYDLYKRLQEITRGLYDPQFAYIPPEDYSNLIFLQPFSMRKVNGSFYVDTFAQRGQQAYADAYSEIGSVSTTDHADKEIISINGIPVEDYVMMMANGTVYDDIVSTEVACSRDVSVRYNCAIKNWGVRCLANSIAPGAATIDYELEGAEIVNADWVAIKAAASEGTEEAERRSVEDKSLFSKPYSVGSVAHSITNSILNRKMVSERRTDNLMDSPEFLEFVEDYMESDGAWIIKLHRFPVTMNGMFLKTITEYLEENGSKINKIIVDVRDFIDPQGDLCMMFFLLRHLTPYAPLAPGPNMHVPYCELGKRFHCSDHRSEHRTFFKPDRDRASINWYSNFETYDRGSNTRKFSKPVHKECRGVFNLAFGFLKENYWEKPIPPEVEPTDIHIISDGTCTGICGIFINAVSYLHLGRVMTVGGAPNIPPAYASGQGSLAISMAEMLEKIDKVGCGGLKDLDYSFDTWEGGVTIPEWEVWPWSPEVYGGYELGRSDFFGENKNDPMEFRRRTGGYNYENHDFYNDDLYEYVANRFFDTDNCFVGDIEKDKECNMEEPKKGVFGHACDATTLTFDEKCDDEVRSGEPGYYVSKDGEVKIMPEEYSVMNYIVIRVIIAIGAVSVGLQFPCIMFCSVGCLMCCGVVNIVYCLLGWILTFLLREEKVDDGSEEKEEDQDMEEKPKKKKPKKEKPKKEKKKPPKKKPPPAERKPLPKKKPKKKDVSDLERLRNFVKAKNEEVKRESEVETPRLSDSFDNEPHDYRSEDYDEEEEEEEDYGGSYNAGYEGGGGGGPPAPPPPPPPPNMTFTGI